MAFLREKQTFDTRGLMLSAMFTALIAAGAFIKMPMSAVPNTMQFLFTTLAGLLLGRRLGLLSVAAYILIGLVGLPVFALGGGIGYVLQPTFGYIIGFAAGTWLAGLIAERAGKRLFVSLLFAGLINMLLVYAIGIVYYYLISKYYLGTPAAAKTLLISCFALTAPGDVVWCVVAALLAKRLRPVLNSPYIRVRRQNAAKSD